MPQSYENIALETHPDDSFARLVLDRPRKLNALSGELLKDLTAGLREVSDDDEIKGVLIQGTGRVFCGGVDLNELKEMNPRRGHELGQTLKTIFHLIRSSETVFVAAIQEGCYGGAFELALACDGVVAEQGAEMGLPEIQLGVPSMIDAALLQETVGLMRAREILLTGNAYPVETLRDWGMINRVVAPDRLESQARSLLGEMIKNPSRTLGMQKELIRSWMNVPLEEGIKQSIDVFALSVEDNEHLRREANRILGGE